MARLFYLTKMRTRLQPYFAIWSLYVQSEQARNLLTKPLANMKISKTVLQAVAVAVVVSTTISACANDSVSPEKEKAAKAKKLDPCPACGMG